MGSGLPTVANRATQLSTLAMEKSLRMPDVNPRKQIATAEVGQRTKKTSWRKKVSELWRKIFGFTQPRETLRFLPPWLLNGNNVLEVDGVKSGEAARYKIWALQRLALDWSTYDLTIYTDGSATYGTAIGGRGN